MEGRVGGLEFVEFTIDNAIAVIELARPDRDNAANLQMLVDLFDALDAADSDDDVAVVVLAAQGRNFCVGADLEAGFQRADEEWPPAFRDFVERFGTVGGVPRDAGGVVTLRMAAMRKPLVVAVQGAAVGVGASMLLPCDIRIVAESARVGFVFARRGIAAESVASWFLPRVVGITRATDWVLTGRLVEAPELHAAGLATAVAPDLELRQTAMGVARDIAVNTSRVAAGVARRLLWGMLSEPSPWVAHGHESHVVWSAPTEGDVAEGVTSFLEKRQPDFPLRVPRDFPGYVPPWPEVLVADDSD